MDARLERLATLGQRLIDLRKTLSDVRTELQTVEAEFRQLANRLPGSETDGPSVDPSAPADVPLGLTERAREYFRANPSAKIRADELADVLGVREQLPSLRSALSRMGKSGELTVYERGLYGLAPLPDVPAPINGDTQANGESKSWLGGSVFPELPKV